MTIRGFLTWYFGAIALAGAAGAGAIHSLAHQRAEAVAKADPAQQAVFAAAASTASVSETPAMPVPPVPPTLHRHVVAAAHPATRPATRHAPMLATATPPRRTPSYRAGPSHYPDDEDDLRAESSPPPPPGYGAPPRAYPYAPEYGASYAYGPRYSYYRSF